MEWQTKKITLNFDDDDRQDSQFWAYWQDPQTQELATTNGLNKVVIERHGDPNLLEPYVDHQGQEWNPPNSPLEVFTEDNGSSLEAFGLSIFTDNGIHHFLMNEDTIRGLVSAIVEITNQPNPKGGTPYLSNIDKVIQPLSTEKAQTDTPATRIGNYSGYKNYANEEWETYITGLCTDLWNHSLDKYINSKDLSASLRVRSCELAPHLNGIEYESGQSAGYLSPSECMKDGLTYEALIHMRMFLELKETGVGKEQTFVFFGVFPLLTREGTLILDGTECYPNDSYYTFLRNRVSSVTQRASRIAAGRIRKAMNTILDGVPGIQQETPYSLLDKRTFQRLDGLTDLSSHNHFKRVDIVSEAD